MSHRPRPKDLIPHIYVTGPFVPSFPPHLPSLLYTRIHSGVISYSLRLIVDIVTLFIGLVAMTGRQQSVLRSRLPYFDQGERFEVLAAFVNGCLLLFVSAAAGDAVDDG